jgi:hypothetical protein
VNKASRLYRIQRGHEPEFLGSVCQEETTTAGAPSAKDNFEKSNTCQPLDDTKLFATHMQEFATKIHQILWNCDPGLIRGVW